MADNLSLTKEHLEFLLHQIERLEAKLKVANVLETKDHWEQEGFTIETWERTLGYCDDEEKREGIKRHLVNLL